MSGIHAVQHSLIYWQLIKAIRLRFSRKHHCSSSLLHPSTTLDLEPRHKTCRHAIPVCRIGLGHQEVQHSLLVCACLLAESFTWKPGWGRANPLLVLYKSGCLFLSKTTFKLQGRKHLPDLWPNRPPCSVIFKIRYQSPKKNKPVSHSSLNRDASYSYFTATLFVLLKMDFLSRADSKVNSLKKELWESDLSKSERSIANDDETSPVARHFWLDMTFASLRFLGAEVLKSQKCQGGSRLSI